MERVLSPEMKAVFVMILTVVRLHESYSRSERAGILRGEREVGRPKVVLQSYIVVSLYRGVRAVGIQSGRYWSQ